MQVIRIVIVPELPVVQAICLSIVKNRLLVVKPVSKHFHGNGQILREIAHAYTIVISFEKVLMAWLQKIGCAHSGIVPPQGRVQVSVMGIHLHDLVCQVWKLRIHCFSELILSKKTFGAIKLNK